MDEGNTEGLVRRRPHCEHCQDVIGVYEPLVLVTDSGCYETSLTAEPDLYETEHLCYHRACFDKTHGDWG